MGAEGIGLPCQIKASRQWVAEVPRPTAEMTESSTCGSIAHAVLSYA